MSKVKKLTQKGFTLLEMLVVLFIISLLLLLFIPNVGTHQNKAEETGNAALQQVLQTQVNLYKTEGEGNPDTFEDLGEYLTQDQIKKAMDKFTLSNGIVTINDGE